MKMRRTKHIGQIKPKFSPAFLDNKEIIALPPSSCWSCMIWERLASK